MTENINNFTESRNLYQRAIKVIPLGTQTFSKAAMQYPQESPLYIERGEGPYLYDVDGNRFLDFTSALGANILGYGYPKVREAVEHQLKMGSIFTLPHKLETEVAEMLVENIECAEMVRYGKNGSDVTSAAVRVARAYTGRDKIALCGYHGWQDWYIATTPFNMGIPHAVKELSFTFKYNDIDSLERLFTENPGQIGVVIMEAVVAEMPSNNFLRKVKDLFARKGAVLVFDEIVNGCRIALGGAGEYFGVTPDLAAFGKPMANGLPFAMICGRKEIMQLFDRVFFSFTFGGDTLSLAAVKATVEEIIEKDVIKYLGDEGGYFKCELNKLIEKLGIEDMMECVGLDAHAKFRLMEISPEGPFWMRTLLMQEAARRGILMLLANNLTYSHTREHLDDALAKYDEIFSIFAQVKSEGNTVEAYEKRIKGRPIEPLFQVRRQ